MYAVVCVNLQRSPERWAYMTKQATALGIPIQRLDAVDGVGQLPRHFHFDFLDKSGRIASQLTSGEVGCYASHLLAYEQFLLTKNPCVVVLEDDAELSDDFVRCVDEAIKAAPNGWDIIHLSTKTKRLPYPIIQLPVGRSLVRYWRYPVNTAAYVISRPGAIKLLHPRRRTRPIDQETRHFWIMGLRVLGIYPAPVAQNEDFATTIVGARDDRRWASELSKLYGRLVIAYRLGPAGIVYCWWHRVTGSAARRDAKHTG